MTENSPYKEFRLDGWPLCPNCGEDELYSIAMMAWKGEGERPTIEQCVQGEMVCYKCSWDSRTGGIDKRVELVRELKGTRCFCGAKKITMQTFCKQDYFALPRAMRSALYQGIFDGYVEAYAEARKHLERREDLLERRRVNQAPGRCIN